MKKERDWKFIIGTVILAALLILLAVFFWRTVARQAAQVKEEEARQKAEAVEAIYVYVGDGLKTGVFVDMKTDQVFKASVPDEGIYNKKGTLIRGDVLEEGDQVRLYGDSVMTEDVPPEYPGVERMERTGRATLEQAQVYREIAEKAVRAAGQIS